MSIKSPAMLEKTVSNEQALWAAGPETSPRQARLQGRVLRLLRRLPPLEADYVYFFYFRRLSQETIANLWDCTQPSVHYRLSRAADRLRFLLALPAVATPRRVAAGLQRHAAEIGIDATDIEIVRVMLLTTNQSEAGARVGLTQSQARWRYYRTMKRLQAYLDRPEARADRAERRRLRFYLQAMRATAENPKMLTKD